MRRSRRGFLPLILGLLAPALVLAARAPSLDLRGYRLMFYDPEVPHVLEKGGGLEFLRWSQTVVLDAEEGVERHIRFDLAWDGRGEPPDEVIVAELDGARDDTCELLDENGGASGQWVRVTQFAFAHLGQPLTCALQAPADFAQTRRWTAHVVLRRPRPPRVEDRFALLLLVQPPYPARALELAVEGPKDPAPYIEPLGWDVELRRQELPLGRLRVSLLLANVAALPFYEGLGTLSGRVPALAVGSGESWDELAMQHRAFFDSAARAQGPLLALAGRVLGQPDALASVREAVRSALDDTALDGGGGRGGAWQLPARASATAESGKGDEPSRAALLMALLRAAELRAEPLLLSRSGHRVSPTQAFPLLDTTLVLIPGVELEPGAGPLIIDPARGSSWLGALDEDLLGRDALMPGPEGARWLRLPSQAGQRNWTLNSKEREDGDFDVELAGVLSGAVAARVRDWDAATRPAEGRPDADLAWLGGPFRDVLAPEVEELPGGRLRLRAHGVVPRAVALPSGRLAAPLLPEPAAETPEVTWAYGRDVRPLRADILENWTFRGSRSGGGGACSSRVTPYWQTDCIASWSGPVFTRRWKAEFFPGVLPAPAAAEVERWAEAGREVFLGVKAP